MSASINSGRPFDHELRSLWLRFVSLVRAAAAAAAAAFFASMSLELSRRRPPPTAAVSRSRHRGLSRDPQGPPILHGSLDLKNSFPAKKIDLGTRSWKHFGFSEIWRRSTCFRFRLRNETKSFSELGTFKLKPPRAFYTSAFYTSAFYTRPLYSSKQKNKLLGLMLCRAYAWITISLTYVMDLIVVDHDHCYFDLQEYFENLYKTQTGQAF